jgi:hypothetical protein
VGLLGQRPAALSCTAAFEVSPGQRAALERCRAELYEQHRARDASCSVWVEYSVPGLHQTRIDLLHGPGGSSWGEALVLSRACFYACAWTGLYAAHVAAWRLLRPPAVYGNVKRLCLDCEGLLQRAQPQTMETEKKHDALTTHKRRGGPS